MTEQPGSTSSLGKILTLIFVFSMIMGAGPGLLLINSPEPVLNFPPVYLWGVLWYLVQVGVVLAAYFWCWSDD